MNACRLILSNSQNLLSTMLKLILTRKHKLNLSANTAEWPFKCFPGEETSRHQLHRKKFIKQSWLMMFNLLSHPIELQLQWNQTHRCRLLRGPTAAGRSSARRWSPHTCPDNGGTLNIIKSRCQTNQIISSSVDEIWWRSFSQQHTTLITYYTMSAH